MTAVETQERESGRVSIRFVVTTLMIASTLLVTGAVVGLNLMFDIRLAEEIAVDQFVSISERSAERSLDLGRRGKQLATALSHTRGVDDSDTAAVDHPLVMPMIEMMREGDGIFSLFAGYEDGHYIEVSNLDADPGLRESWGAMPEERWIINRVYSEGSSRIERRQFLGAALQVTREIISESDYYPNTRPWFASATTDVVHKSDPYLLSMVKRRGLSYVRKTSQGSVVGAIILLSSLDRLIQNTKFPDSSQAIVFDDNGFVIAAWPTETGGELSPELSVLDLNALAADESQHSMLQRMSVAGHDHFAYVRPLTQQSPNAPEIFITQLVLPDEITAPYTRRLWLLLGVSLALVLALMPLVLWLSRWLVEPMKKLAQENEKVRRREYASVASIDSKIAEVRQLSLSLVAMSESICDYERQQKELRNALVQLIAQAIDQKSPYTGGHCERVPEIAFALLQAANDDAGEAFADFEFSGEDDWVAFKTAAWLHDCGKITTPEHIVDKGSKLEAIYNRIHEVRMRFEVLLRDAEIEFWQAVSADPARKDELHGNLSRRREQIVQDFEFVARCNVGGEFMDESQLTRLAAIADQTWVRQLDDRLGMSPVEEQQLSAYPSSTPQTEKLLSDKPEHRIVREDAGTRFAGLGFTMTPPPIKQNLGEVYNLSVARGTLTQEDRYIINEHISTTIQMLETLPWPDELSAVAEYAGGHHEKMDGTGYPRGLKGESLSVPARIMAIADIFEALTASDRPYKKAKTLSESLNIMKFMVKDQHIDSALFRLFVSSKVDLWYAKKFLQPEQLDEVDRDALLAGL